MIGLSQLYHYFYTFADKTLYGWSEIWGRLFVKIYVVVLLLDNAVLWFFTYLFYRQIKDAMIVLHYNVDFGVDLVGSPEKIFLIPALGLFAAVFNFLLLFLFVKDRNFNFLAHFLLAASLLINIFLSLALGPLYLVNFS